MTYTLTDVARAVRSVSGVTALFAGGVYVGESAGVRTFPYAVLDVISATPLQTFDRDGFTVRLQFAMYGDLDAGPNALSTLAGSLRNLLSRTRVTVSGVDVFGVNYADERGPFRDADRWRVDVDFIIQGLRNS